MKIFVTGTDTNVGKTYVSQHILKNYSAQGYKTLGIKPIASGGNEDILQLANASSIKLPFVDINPFLFEQPIAPHIAAEQQGIHLSVDILLSKLNKALAYPADLHLIEGAGGWFTPLNATETLADFVQQLNCAVLLVVGIRLGCINHAILTYRAIKLANIPIVGWIANCNIPNVEETPQIIATLMHWLDIPCLNIVKYQQKEIATIFDY